MRTFKALFYNQIILLQRGFKRFLILFVFYLVSLIAYQLENTGYLPIKSIISFILCVCGACVVGCSSVDFDFEKKENMREYIFSQGINKPIFIISKLAVPVILSSIAAVIPICISLYGKVYQGLNVSFVLMEACVACCALIWSLFVLATDLLFDNIILLSFINSIGSVAVTVGVLFLTSPYKKPAWIFFTTAGLFIVIMFCLCYVILSVKEIKIQFCKYEGESKR